MANYKTYTAEQYIKFLSLPFNENFGFTEEEASDWFLSQPGAQPVIRSYGVNKQMLLDTLIPELKKRLKGGYMVFLMYTVTEGGGAGNWINHYMQDTSQGALQTLIDDCDYINSVSKKNGVAKGAPEVYNWTPYVDDAGVDSNAILASMPDYSIGDKIMPSTMAGNAWAFGAEWCQRNWTGAPPGVYFGNPYDTFINTLKNAGIDPFNYNKDDNNKKNEQIKKDESKDKKINPPSIDNKVSNTIKDIKDRFLKLFDNSVFYNSSDMMSNSLITVTKTYNNMYKIGLNMDTFNSIFEVKPDTSKKLPPVKNTPEATPAPSPQPDHQYAHIFDRDYYVYQDYGLSSWYLTVSQYDPNFYPMRRHSGIDLTPRGELGTHIKIYACADMRVHWVGIDQFNTYYIMFTTNGTNCIYYGHLSSVLVSTGQTVKKGQHIGFLGNANTVWHIHYEYNNNIRSVGIASSEDINPYFLIPGQTGNIPINTTIKV